MHLYLAQHGYAKDKSEDPNRPLTEKGRDEVERVGQALQRLLLQVQEVWHSGKTRAMQTAKILSLTVEAAQGITQREGLGPTDDVAPIAEALRESGHDMMLVGHLPFLDRLASLLLAGDEEAGIVAFRKGGVVCLEFEDNHWAVAWMLTPDLLPG
jgi:phosphohistidine phosphatase